MVVGGHRFRSGWVRSGQVWELETYGYSSGKGEPWNLEGSEAGAAGTTLPALLAAENFGL